MNKYRASPIQWNANACCHASGAIAWGRYSARFWGGTKQRKSTVDPNRKSGDEDAGSMSAFVVFSAMGFYPITPGLPHYTITSPIFPKEEHAGTEPGNGLPVCSC